MRLIGGGESIGGTQRTLSETAPAANAQPYRRSFASDAQLGQRCGASIQSRKVGSRRDFRQPSRIAPAKDRRRNPAGPGAAAKKRGCGETQIRGVTYFRAH